MKDTLIIGNPPLTVRVRRNAQARRLSLRVSRLDGRVTLTLPKRVPLRMGEAFIQERESWIRAQLAEISPVARPEFGAEIPFRGARIPILRGEGRRVTLSDAGLAVPDGPVAPALRAFLRETARAHLSAASDRYAAQLGRGYGRITLRDTRSRWGSCSGQGDLMYSWRLIMAPDAVSDYVAAHEVAHLVEMNHSAAFWAVVEGLCPDWRVHRRWLHEHGAELHQLRFED